MVTTDQAQTLMAYPVVFVPQSTVTAAMTSGDPRGALAAQVDIGDSGNQADFIRLCIHVFSSLPCDVERVGDIGTGHGYLSGQPVVPASDGSGNLPTPATDVTKDATSVGGTAIDWLDTPPSGYVAHAVWVFDQHYFLAFAPHGVSCAVPLQLRGLGLAAVVSAVVDPQMNGGCGVWIGPTASAPTVDAAQQSTDSANQSSVSTTYSADGTSPVYAASVFMRTLNVQAGMFVDIFCQLSVAPPDDSNTLGGINLGPGPQQDPDNGGGN